MKSIITLAAALVFSVASYANPIERTSGDVSASFKKDFASARVLSTEVRDNFTKVTFSQNDIIMTAFYSKTGDLMAVTRNILSTQLPVELMMSLKENYGSYWITELFELTSEEANGYYVSLENAGMKVSLRSNGGVWEVYSTVSK